MRKRLWQKHGGEGGACDLNHMCAKVWFLPDCVKAARMEQ
jgi:hypothetical protein